MEKKIAFTELENKQKEALEAFQVIIDNIKNKETVDKTDLTKSILRVITRLASERAGAMIDEHSDTFKNKIISFADKIEQASKNLILNLNPIDANLLSKSLAESLSDKKVEIRENSELFRGDFIFQMGAVEIGDLISEQILILDEEKETTEESNKSGIESEEVGSADKEAPQKTEKESMSEIDNDKNSSLSLTQAIDSINLSGKLTTSGRVHKYDGHFLECDGFPANLGSICSVATSDGTETLAEIIGFKKGNNILSMFESDTKIQSGAKVSVIDEGHDIKVGGSLLGRVIDAMGNPYDGKPMGSLRETWPLNGKFLNPLSRNSVNKPLDVGVRAINSLLTVGKGQRVGIIAGSGVGKSVLLGMMCRYTEAEIVVVGLIGERGRK